MPSNLRQNPFTKAFSWQTITGEAHTVSEYRHLPGLYGILLKELPKPDSVQVTFMNTSTQAVIVNQDPLAGQVRVDYQRGHILFNVSDNGKAVSVNYEGGGTNLNMEALKEIVTDIVS